MCEISKQLSDVRVGYKLVAMNEQGEFFSILTGQKYQLGKVQDPPEIVSPISNIYNGCPEKYLFKNWGHYLLHYIGKTSAFIHKKDILILEAQQYPCKEGYTYQVIEISFEGEVYESVSFLFYKSITGSVISSMKLIQ